MATFKAKPTVIDDLQTEAGSLKTVTLEIPADQDLSGLEAGKEYLFTSAEIEAVVEEAGETQVDDSSAASTEGQAEDAPATEGEAAAGEASAANETKE